jgi:hypothetical protein
MEVFATFGLVVLAGLAFPILLVFSALVFDLIAVIYVVITTIGSRKRKPGTFEAVARSGVPRESRGRLLFGSFGAGIASHRTTSGRHRS